MRLLCAWCGILIKEGSDKNGISHGICPECYEAQKEIFLLTMKGVKIETTNNTR